MSSPATPDIIMTGTQTGVRRPVHLVDGQVEGGYTGAHELIGPSFGDDPELDFREVPVQLQSLRGRRTLAASPAAYDEHLSSSNGIATSLLC